MLAVIQACRKTRASAKSSMQSHMWECPYSVNCTMPSGFSLTLYTESTAGDRTLGPLVHFSLCPQYIQSLEVCILLWLSRALMHQPVPLYSEDISQLLWMVSMASWPHISSNPVYRPNVMEGTIPVFIMLDNIVEIAAEGEGRTTKLHEHWLSTHPTCSMGKWASCLWAVENCHTAILHDVLFTCGPQTQFQIEWGSLP